MTPPTPAISADTRSGLVLSERTSETDDQRIQEVTPLPPPEHLIRFFPIAEHAGGTADPAHPTVGAADHEPARTTACWWSSAPARSTTQPRRWTMRAA